MALMVCAFVVITFFISGLLDILEYPIIKILLFAGFSIIVIMSVSIAIKNDSKKNRLEENPQDDLH